MSDHHRLYSTAEIAVMREPPLALQSVRDAARARGIEPVQYVGRAALWSADQVREILEPLPRGRRPRKNADQASSSSRVS